MSIGAAGAPTLQGRTACPEQPVGAIAMMNDAFDELYREVVLDHHRSPRGTRQVHRVDRHAEGRNPTCGDEVRVELELDGGCIADVSVRCHGCAISVAAGSMLAELTRGKSLAEATRITEALGRMLRGEEPEAGLDLGDLEALAGVRKYPARVKCAALAGVTLAQALQSSEEGARGRSGIAADRHVRAATTEGTGS